MCAYGCIWVFMGALGYTNTNAQENNTKRDINGQAGYDSRPCMAGKFPQKRHICEHRHKGARRDSGGWVCVRVGVGGCISTQQTQNKANRDTDRSTGHNFGKGVWRKLLDKDDEVGTWVSQITQGNCGCVRGAQVPLNVSYTAHDACAQGKTRKKRKIGKIIGHCKSGQNVKRGKTT